MTKRSVIQSRTILQDACGGQKINLYPTESGKRQRILNTNELSVKKKPVGASTNRFHTKNTGEEKFKRRNTRRWGFKGLTIVIRTEGGGELAPTENN